ncbi:hypothetical protein ACNQGP_05730 [Flavobacterium sp. GT2N3]
MFAKAEIITAIEKGMTIPSEAIMTENNKNFVLLLPNQKNEDPFK